MKYQKTYQTYEDFERQELHAFSSTWQGQIEDLESDFFIDDFSDVFKKRRQDDDEDASW